MAWYDIKKFGWVRQRSAYQDLEYRRSQRAAYAQQDASNGDALNNSMATALQNRISQAATLAGNAALKRVQAAAKAKQAEAQKQLDQTMKNLDSAQKTADAAGVLNDPIDNPGSTVDVTA